MPTPYFERFGITLFHADCFDVLPSLKKQSVHMILVDPPYGVRFESTRRAKRYGPIHGDDGSFDVKRSMSLALPALIPRRRVYCFGRWNFDDLPIHSQQELIWDTGAHGIGSHDSEWGKSHEYLQYFVYHKYTKRLDAGQGFERIKAPSVLRFSRVPARSGVYPAEKPVDLLRFLIERSSLHGETILDFCAGSGSTLEAALLEDRRAIGIEVREEACALIAERIEKVAGEGPRGKSRPRPDMRPAVGDGVPGEPPSVGLVEAIDLLLEVDRRIVSRILQVTAYDLDDIEFRGTAKQFLQIVQDTANERGVRLPFNTPRELMGQVRARIEELREAGWTRQETSKTRGQQTWEFRWRRLRSNG